MTLLKATGIKKKFGDQEVLRGIDLEVRRGDVIAVIGPSGSGKTTLLRCLEFLERPDEGLMVFDGQEIDMPTAPKATVAALRKRTAFVFQNYNLFLNRTALGNVTEGLIVARRMPRSRAEEIGRRMLAKVGMSGKENSRPQELSGGQQQRVAIARALAGNPDLILFDEPTSALDPELIGEVLGVMRQLAEEGMTMIVVTHEIGFARNVSNKVLFMEDGLITEMGSSAEFFANPRQERVRSFIRRLENGQGE